MNQLWSLSFPYWHLILRATLIYIAVLFLLRLSGKREIGQMGTGEFVSILLISNAVQNSMNGGDNSVTTGLILATIIVLLSNLIAYLTFKSKKMENILQGQPTLLVHKGKLLHKNLDKELLNVHELKIMLRKQGIHYLDEIYEAVLESDGSISILKNTEVDQKHLS